MSKTSVLQVKDLKTYFYTGNGIVRSVDGVSFTLNKGEITAIVGESGSGKSVTSYSIMRLLDNPGKIVDGQIFLNDMELAKASESEMRKIRGNKISMIFQEPLTSLNPVFKIGKQIDEVILEHQKINKKEAKAKSIQMLKQVGIPRASEVYNSYPHLLSGGMRQRVMIAIALICRPEILIADEPTTALDVTIQAQILNLLKEIRQDLNTSILLITHDLGVVSEVADRVLVMYAGKIVEDTNVFELFNNPKHPYTKGLLASTPNINDEMDRLDSIEGTIPNNKEIIKGCKFASRCPFVMKQCHLSEPELFDVGDSKVRCVMFDKEEGENGRHYNEQRETTK